MRNSRIVNLAQSLTAITSTWSPKVVAELNAIQFKLAKVHGDFVWHSHEETDEAFIVVKGALVIEFREQSFTINEGELFVVPCGVEHITRAYEECHILIIEPRGVVNTGETSSPLTAPLDQWI